MDTESVTHFHRNFGTSLQPLTAAIIAVHKIHPAFTFTTTLQPLRMPHPLATDDVGAHRFEKTDMAFNPITAGVLTFAATELADMKMIQHHRKALFKDLRVGQARVD